MSTASLGLACLVGACLVTAMLYLPTNQRTNQHVRANLAFRPFQDPRNGRNGRHGAPMGSLVGKYIYIVSTQRSEIHLSRLILGRGRGN